jgi:cohesin complex subunit SA-1/2
MTFIPKLLKKFGPVPDAASSVLRIEQLMNLDVFQELRQSAAYSSLLDEINRQFLTHSDEGVLKEASAALMHAKKFEDLEEVTEAKLGQLKDETVNSLGNIVRGKDPATANFSETSLTELINTVRRLEHLSGITDCVEILETPFPATPDKAAIPVDVLLELLKRGVVADELEDELALRTLKALSFYFMWKIAGLNSARNDEIDNEDIDAFVERRDKAVQAMTTILAKREDVDNVDITTASTLLQLAATFAASSVPRLAELSKPLDKQTQDQIMTVFDAVEKTFAKSQGKKLEPDEHAEPEDDAEETRSNEDEVDASTQLMLEQRLCEFTSKIVLAALGQVLDPKTWKKRLARNQLQLGSNYKEVINYLDRASVGRPGVRRGPQPKKAPQPPQPKKKSAEMVVDSDEEEEEDPIEDGEEEGHEEHEKEPEEEEHGGSEKDGSEPDPEAELPADEDQDEEMVDV